MYSRTSPIYVVSLRRIVTEIVENVAVADAAVAVVDADAVAVAVVS